MTRRQKTEDRRQKTEDRRQKAEDRRQKTEDRRQKSEVRRQMKKRFCRHCYFSRIIADTLHCVHNPPEVDYDTGEARWPIVKEDYFCGRFRYIDEDAPEQDRWLGSSLPIYTDRFGDYCKIPLTQGRYAKVDPEDYIWLSQFRWYCNKRYHTCYAVRNAGGGKEQKKVLMHREIMNTPKHLVCDHINRYGLDNRKGNLRNCTKQQNNYNSGSQCNSSSRYKGVYWNNGMSKWAACIKGGGKKRHLGYFTDETEAARAYDKAAKKFQGEYASLNFVSRIENRVSNPLIQQLPKFPPKNPYLKSTSSV